MKNPELWRAVSGQMQMTLTPALYNTVFNGEALWIEDRQGNRVTLGVSSVFTRSLIHKRVQKDLLAALKDIDGIEDIEYSIGRKAPKPAAKSTPVIAQKTSVAQKPTTQQTGRTTTGPKKHPVLNPKYTFDTFVVGGSNELAYAACIGVSKNPGHKYNPLYLYGGVGLGKTHLMQAVGNEILKNDPNKRIEYITSEAFTNEFVDSIKHKTTTNFARKFRNVDVLIIDDMQFLTGKEKTQEEFFHTFNALHQTNKQIIISSDRPPKAIQHLDDRLRSRFEAGMTADVQSPDLETRTAILQKKAESESFDLPPDVANHLAQHIKQNIRELEGALTQMIAICELKNSPATIAMADDILGELVVKRSRKSRLSPKTVIEKVASHYNLTSDDIIGPKRGRSIVVPRQIAMYIMRSELGLSFPIIANACGGRDHTTAIHSIDKMERLVASDEAMRNEISVVKEEVFA